MAEFLRGRYELLNTLGRGGEARVVKALDHQHQRVVALKIRHLQGLDRGDVLAEARVLLDLPPHPALPIVRDDFFEGDDYVIAMDYVDGVDLAKLLAAGSDNGLAWSSALGYLADAAEALRHLHAQHPPVIHGDVKPANLILTRGGRVKVVDFGMSSTLGSPRRAGTPGFQAPELAAGHPPSPASDIYSLAATAFALLTGSAPSGVLPTWEGFEPDEATRLEEALRRGLAMDPGRRPASPGELVERLRTGWVASLPGGVTTFCLSDIEGSTALWDAQPEAMAVALVRHDDLINEAVATHRGRVLKSMGEGDSTVSIFRSASDAVAAAVAASRALSSEPWPDGMCMSVRFALHTGEAERRGSDYYGPAMNLAARVRGEARAGEILCSTTTAELVDKEIPEGCALVDVGMHRLRGIQMPERLFAVTGPGLEVAHSSTECPYRGLLAYDVDDRDIFFGRDAVVASLLARLEDGQVLAVVGASGSGKSSVLRAGVLAAVRAGASDWCDGVVVTPGDQPTFPQCDRATVIIVDQFEELFLLCDDAELRRAYVDALLDHDGPVVIGLRADCYGRLTAFPRLSHAVVSNQLLLGAMDADELRSAIVSPAERAGLRLEPGLADLLVADVAGEPGSLPLLSHALRATWERREGRTLTLEGYRSSGGVESAIARSADRVTESVTAADRPLLRSVFLRLTEFGDGIEETRRRVEVGDLLTEGCTQARLDGLLERLADARLITLDRTSVEVAHEALIREWPTLRRWLDEDREGLRLHRRLSEAARLWDSAGREPSDLYRGARLDASREWFESTHPELNEAEQVFLQESMQRRQDEQRDLEARAAAQVRANRRLRRRLAAAVLALVVAIGSGVVAVAQRDRAGSERDNAQASARASALRALIDSSRAQRSTKRDLAALLAVAAYRLDPSPASEGALLGTFTGSPGYEGAVPVPGGSSLVGELLPDGHTYAAVDDQVGVHLIDLRTGASEAELPKLHGGHDGDAVVAASPDGRYLALASDGPDDPNLLTEWDLRARARRFADMRLGYPPGSLAFSDDGRLLAVSGGPDASVEVRSATDGSLVTRVPSLSRPPGAHLHAYTAAVRFLRDGTLAVGSQSGVIRIVDPTTGRELRRLGGPRETSEVQLRLTDDGRMLVGTGYEGTDEWNLTTGATAWSRPAPGNCNQIAVATVISSVLCARADGRVQAFDLLTGSVTQNHFDYQLGLVSGINVSDDGNVLVEVGGPALGVWRLDGAGPITTRLLGRRGLVAQEFVSATTLLVGPINPATGGVMHPRLIDATTGVVLDRLPNVVLATATPTAGRLLALFADGQAGFYDLVAHRRIPGTHVDVPFVPGNTAKSDIALIASNGGDLQGVDLRNGALMAPFVHQSSSIGGIRVDRAGGHLLTLEDGGKLQPRRPDGRTNGTAIPGSNAAVGLHTLVVSTDDGRISVLDPTTFRPDGRPIPSIIGSVDQLVLSRDERRLLVVGTDGTIRIADMGTHEFIGDPISFGDAPLSPVIFSADRRLLAYGASDGIDVWHLDPAVMVRAACQVASRNLTPLEWHTYVAGLGPYERVCPGQPAA
jgi:serine/threonine protein kinase/WD40 repeat protein